MHRAGLRYKLGRPILRRCRISINEISKMNMGTATTEAASDPATPSNGAHHHEIHALPPAFIQKAHWHYTSVKKASLDLDENVIDFRRGLTPQQKHELTSVGIISASTIASACQGYKQARLDSNQPVDGVQDATIYEHKTFPGRS